MHQKVEIESDGASSSSSSTGVSSSFEDIERLKNPRSRPNYLKATSSWEKKKMINQVSNLTDSECSTVSLDDKKFNLLSTKSKPKISSNFKRNSSMRSLRILMSKPKSCPQVPEGESVIKATCSSTLKDSKVPLVEVEPEERETEKISALRVCTYSYCSLHGHHSHSSTPPLKRLLSKRRRFSKSVRGRTQSGTNESFKDTNTGQLVGNEDSKGRKRWKNSKEVSSKSKLKVAKEDENRNLVCEPVGTDDVAKKNELGDGKKKKMSMWYLIHQQMVSGLTVKRENQEMELEKTNNEGKEMVTEIKETGNQDLEIEKTNAVKMVREAIEKILLPEVPDQSPEEISICSDAPKEELLEKQNPNEDFQGEKAKIISPKSWSNFKKMILLNKFVKELEKVKKINPQKPTLTPVGQEEEGKKVSVVRKSLESKKSAEEWMLDYALQQAVSELAPTQKRKVELLIKAYETMVQPLNGEKSPLSFHKFKSITTRYGGDHIEGDTREDFDEKNRKSSVAHDPSNVLAKVKENQGRKDESNSIERSLEVDDLMNCSKEDGSKESFVASSFSDRGTIEQFTKGEEVKKEQFSLTESNSKKLEIKEMPLISNVKHDPIIDTESENRVRAFKSKFMKPKNISMWSLIHQQMVAGLEDEGKTKEDENKNESKSENVIDANTGSECDDMESQEVELRKVFAIKMVREAIEKILPEVQDQLSDDQSTISETVSENELVEKKQDEDWGSQIFNSFCSTGEDLTHYSTNKVIYDMSLTQEPTVFPETDKKETKPEKSAEKQAPKRWSNLKKWIVLQRFVKELEKVKDFKPKDFKPKKPQLLPLKLDPESEVVRLKNQMMNEKRNAEEWMLDYALRKVVSELAPKQKKKVELLVKAFETVVPPTEEMKTPVSLSRSKSSEVTKLKNLFSPKIDDSDNDSAETVEKSNIASEGNANKIIGLKSFGKLTNKNQSEKQKHMKMWHLLCQHVVSEITEKVENDHPYREPSDDMSPHENPNTGEKRDDKDPTIEFSKSDAVNLVRNAIEEILVPDNQDDSSDTLSIASDISQDQEILEEKKPRNWDKLKKLILLKRSIKALEKARKLNQRAPHLLPLELRQEEEKAGLKNQLSDERKKAEEWMLDYAVQHIVTKLTPARKRRVSMLVEAFEAVVPLPQF